MNIAFNADCLEAMKEMPDNAFDLAAVDPPYGDGLDGGGVIRTGLENDSTATNRITPVGRTGGKWAAKFGKKL